MTPTDAQPGTDAKIEVFSIRWVQFGKLYHPADVDTRRGRQINLPPKPPEVVTVETLFQYATRLRVEYNGENGER